MRQHIRVIVPAALLAEANNLVAAWASSEADLNTFGAPRFEKGGDLYATHNLWTDPAMLALIGQPVARPAWDTGEAIDLGKAEAARAAIVLWEGEGDLPEVATDRIVVAFPSQPPEAFGLALLPQGDDGLAALAAMGLTQYEPQPININTADSEGLQSLSGIGASLAQAIIDGRPWAAPADLSSLSGISAAMVEGWMADPGLTVE